MKPLLFFFLHVMSWITSVTGFSYPAIVLSSNRVHKRGAAWHPLHSDNFNNGGASSSDDWLESLKARQLELDQQQASLMGHWKSAKCESAMPLSFPDWVRRLDVGEYPVVAVGSSSGNIYVANLETGKSIAQSFDQQEEEPLPGQEQLMRILFGTYDGGGTIAITMQKMLVCSANRQGSVQIWRLDALNQAELVSQGSMRALKGVLVTCLKLDADYLWVGTADGRLQAYEHSSDELPLALQTKPELQWNVGSAILSMDLNPAMGYGVISTAKGTVHLFSMEDDDEMVAEWIPPFDSGVRQSSNGYILSCALVEYPEEGGYCVACGCNDGSIYVQPLNYQCGVFDENCILKPNSGQLSPRHSGPVKCLTSPLPGLLLSGGQDGSVRVWNIVENKSSFLYQFIGYKVWLGTIWTDGSRIVSDGADNSVIVHDFSSEKL